MKNIVSRKLMKDAGYNPAGCTGLSKHPAGSIFEVFLFRIPFIYRMSLCNILLPLVCFWKSPNFCPLNLNPCLSRSKDHTTVHCRRVDSIALGLQITQERHLPLAILRSSPLPGSIQIQSGTQHPDQPNPPIYPRFNHGCTISQINNLCSFHGKDARLCRSHQL